MNVRIMTNNVWGDYFGNEVEFRDEQLLKVYKKYAPDVIGFQEVTETWHLSPIWKKLSSEYSFCGTEKSEPNNYTPLIYRTDRFRLVEQGWKLLPETPDFSKSITWIVLVELATDRIFACCNTHFWYKEGAEHDLLRVKNANCLITLMKNLQAEYGCPVFAFGDMNCGDGSPAFCEFEKNGAIDLFDVAKQKRDVVSYHGYPVRGEDGRYHSVADMLTPYHHPTSYDHIFALGEVEAIKHDVVLDQDALDATDHSPVYCDVKF